MRVQKTRLTSWDGPLPERGEYLQTPAGSTYRVLEVRPVVKPDAKSVAVLKIWRLDPDELEHLPPSAVVHGFAWNSRAPRRGR